MIEFPTGLNSQTPADNSQILCADNGNVAGKFTLSALWTWISNKISAIFASDVTFGDNITVSGDVNSTGMVTSVFTADIVVTNAAIVNEDLTVTEDVTVGGDVSVTGNISTANGSVAADSVTAGTSMQVGTDATIRQWLIVGLHDPNEIQVEGDAYGEVLANSAKLEFWNNLGADGKGTDLQVLPYYDANVIDDDEQVGITIIITNKESNTPYQFDITAKKLADLLTLV